MNFKPYADRILSDLSDKFQLLCLDATSSARFAGSNGPSSKSFLNDVGKQSNFRQRLISGLGAHVFQRLPVVVQFRYPSKKFPATTDRLENKRNEPRPAGAQEGSTDSPS